MTAHECSPGTLLLTSKAREATVVVVIPEATAIPSASAFASTPAITIAVAIVVASGISTSVSTGSSVSSSVSISTSIGVSIVSSVSTSVSIVAVAVVVVAIVVITVVVITVVVVTTSTTNSEIGAIIQESVLSNRDDNRLMVGCGIDGADAVSSSRETISNVSGQNTTLSRSVDSLEESEDVGVRWLGLVEAGQLFGDKVGVTDDLTLSIELLRGSKVGRLSIGERAGLHTSNVHLDRERCVLLDRCITVGREQEFAGRHVLDGRDLTNRGGIA